MAITGIDRTAEMLTRCLRPSTLSTPAESSVALPALPVAPALVVPASDVRGCGSLAE